MSLDALIWATKDAPTANVEEYAVLGALAQEADESGCGAGISIPTIAERTKVSVQTVRRRIHDMLDRGLLGLGDQSIVAYIPADKRPVVYDLLIPFTGFASVARVNRERERKGLPLLTPESRPDIAPPPPRARRADFKPEKRTRKGPRSRSGTAAPTSDNSDLSTREAADDLTTREAADLSDLSTSQVADVTTYLPDADGLPVRPERPPYKGGNPVTTNPENQTPPPPPTPLTTGALRAMPDPEEEGEEDHSEPQISPALRAIVDAVLVDRPTWRVSDIVGALNEALRDRPAAGAAAVRVAMLALARGDYDHPTPTRSPRRLLENGPWWAIPSQRPAGETVAAVASAARCRRHGVRVPESGCPLCAAEDDAPGDGSPGNDAPPQGAGGDSEPAVVAPPEAPSGPQRPESGRRGRRSRVEAAAAARAAIAPNRFAHVHRGAPRGAVAGPLAVPTGAPAAGEHGDDGVA